MNEKGVIVGALEPMFVEARAQGLWFFCGYQELWFSPDELQKAHERGKFVWGPDNWRLLPPSTQLARLKTRAKNAADELVAFEQRMRSN